MFPSGHFPLGHFAVGHFPPVPLVWKSVFGEKRQKEEEEILLLMIQAAFQNGFIK